MSFQPTSLAINTCLVKKVVSVLFVQHVGSVRYLGATKITESEVIRGQVLWLLFSVFLRGLVLNEHSIYKYLNE